MDRHRLPRCQVPDRRVGLCWGRTAALGANVIFRRRARSARHLRNVVDAVPYWWHSIELGAGVVTPGTRSLESLREQADALFPEVKGKTFLDIGAWDGFFCFEAERRGARRVVA